ncbi:hypothetical protein Acr_12g0007610 [Actinidia rufa]|uniref:HTH three-helical bundle domain-containing protein n=1 Tax=Actinidia rufa TaxID=165716 RepID=A0A7J0FHP8_9ERIC|nr:hypothetical protein Acr_12g0007610 [Actinidia rufa]
MQVFPSPVERTVASALLLLSSTPNSLSPPGGSEKSLAWTNSKSKCSSSMICDDGSSAETRAHPIRMVTVVARCHEMKLKVVRKTRSKVFRRPDHQKIYSSKIPAGFSSECAWETTSCVSNSSSAAISSARSGGARENARDLKTKPPVNSGLMRRRAEAIKRLLSNNGCASEVRIRQVLGDTPDTSKALRIPITIENYHHPNLYHFRLNGVEDLSERRMVLVKGKSESW